MGRKLKREEKWILLSIPILFVLGSLFHFLYDLTGQNPIVALIAPVNESVWEHNKMVVLPPILLWAGYYFCLGKKYGVDKDKWFAAALGAVVVMLITIPLVFYFYTEAFGVELLWVDILILLLANVLGQIMGLHVYRYGYGVRWQDAVAVLCLIVLVFEVFTYYPPKLPIFRDGMTGLYGV